MDELYLREHGSSVHMAEKIVYSSNTMEACIETLEGTNAILFFPGSMESYFSQFNIVSLRLKIRKNQFNRDLYVAGAASGSATERYAATDAAESAGKTASGVMPFNVWRD